MGFFKSIKKAFKKTVKDQAAQIQRKENQVGADASFLENDGNEGLGSTAITGEAGDTSDMLLKRKRLLGS